MLKVEKTVTDDQKVSVVDFVATWIRQSKDLEKESDTCYCIDLDSDRITYLIHMNIFKKEEISSITVSNRKLNVCLSIRKDSLPAQCQSDINFIENHIMTLVLASGVGQDLSNDEFTKITNLEPNIQLERSNKVKHILNKIG